MKIPRSTVLEIPGTKTFSAVFAAVFVLDDGGVGGYNHRWIRV